MNYQGAIAGIISGAATVIIWEILVHPDIALISHPDLRSGFGMIPGFVISTLFIFVISNRTAPPSTMVLTEFDHAMAVINSKD